MRISRLPRYTCAAFACVLLLAACGGGSGTAEVPTTVLPVPTGNANGRVVFVRGESAVVVEAEPNDEAASAQRLADSYPGQSTLIVGALDPTGGDAVDAYRARFPLRAAVRVALEHLPANDFTLSLYDPLTMQFISSASGPDASLEFVGLGVVDLVVMSTSGGKYNLTLDVQIVTPELGEREPNDGATTANVLGELRLGDSLVVLGDAHAGGDEVDAFLIACPQTAQVSFDLTIGAFSDTLLRVSDVTAGVSSPLPLLALDGPASEPRRGNVGVSPGTLLLIEVVAEAGGGPWRLSLGAQSPSSSKLRPGVASARAREPRVAPLDEEARWFSTPPAYGDVQGDVVAGEVLACFCPGRATDGLAAADSRGCRLEEESPHVCLMTFDLPIGQSLEQQERQTFARCCALAGDPCLQYAEPNYLRQPLTEPDDTLYGIQSWHYEMLNLPNAWAVTTGNASTIVAVIDTGRLNHPDLSARQIAGYDFVTGQYAGDGDGVDPNPDDRGIQTQYHGGHVAGTIGAVSNNTTGVAGVTWAGSIMPLRALGDYGYGTDFDISNAIYYAARLANNSGALPAARADVINMSLGGGGFSQTTNAACQAAKDEGVTIIAAAGNNNNSAPNYPAAYNSVISIVALDAQRSRAPYSSYGSTVTLSAPGGNTSVDTNGDGYGDGVLSTGRNASGPIYLLQNGTSMASPHAAGVAALLIGLDATLTPDEVQATLIQTAVDLGPTGRDDSYGHGLIDALAAVHAIVGAPTPPVPEPILDLTPKVINFGIIRFETSVLVRNVGTGMLMVSDAVVATESGGNWLSARLINSTGSSTNVQNVIVTVDRTGLDAGTYVGSVTVESDGGDQIITVLAQVANTLPPTPNINIRVQAISTETGAVVQERVVNPSVSLDYVFNGLPAGQYVFVAGTDVDGDGVICEEGDFCGSYPSTAEPKPVLITRDFTTANLVFEVSRTTALSAKPGR